MQQALALSQGADLPTDLGAMTEEEQLNYALQMSLRQSASESASGATTEKQTTPVDTEMKDVIINFNTKIF